MTISRQAQEATAWLLSVETPSVVVSGDHDYCSKSSHVAVDPYAEAAWLRKLGGQGKILAVDGESVLFPANRPQTLITALGWAQAPVWPSETEVLVAHAPPSGLFVAAEMRGGRDMGDIALRRVLRDATQLPRLILSGHVHAPKDIFCYRSECRTHKGASRGQDIFEQE